MEKCARCLHAVGAVKGMGIWTPYEHPLNFEDLFCTHRTRPVKLFRSVMAKLGLSNDMQDWLPY